MQNKTSKRLNTGVYAQQAKVKAYKALTFFLSSEK